MVKEFVTIAHNNQKMRYEITAKTSLKSFVKFAIRMMKADVCNTFNAVEIVCDKGFVVFTKTENKDYIAYCYTSLAFHYITSTCYVPCKKAEFYGKID